MSKRLVRVLGLIIGFLCFFSPSSIFASETTTLSKVDGFAIVTKGSKEILRVPLKARHSLSIRTEEGYDIEEDDTVLVGGCLIVVRNIKSQDETDNVGPGDSVEVYPLNGKRRTFPQDAKDPFVIGQKFDGKDGTWGIVLSELEGGIYGYTVVRQDGTMEKRKLPTGEGYEENRDTRIRLVETGPNAGAIIISPLIRWSGSSVKGYEHRQKTPVEITIDSTGRYIVTETGPKSDVTPRK